MNLTTRICLGVAFVLIDFGLGLGAGWKLLHPKPIQQTAAPAVVQTDHSMIEQRVIDPNAKPQQQIPRGDVVQRVDRIVFRPHGAVTAPTSGSNPGVPSSIPSLPGTETIDLTVVKEPDGQQRVIASSPDGTIVGGEDIVVAPSAQEARDLPWAVNVTRHFSKATWDVRVDRDWRFFRFGAAVEQVRSDLNPGRISYDSSVSVGFRF